MVDICEECGRPKPVPMGAPHGNTASPCFAGTDYLDAQASALDCKTHVIKRLRARVQQLEAQLEHYDTTDAENHAVAQVVKSLNRILDEGRQVGKFGGVELQALAERLLKHQAAHAALTGYTG